MPRASLYFFWTRGRSPITAATGSCRFRLAAMWAFRCRRPTWACLSLPVAVSLTRFLTLLLVLFFVAMGCSVRGGGDRSAVGSEQWGVVSQTEVPVLSDHWPLPTL